MYIIANMFALLAVWIAVGALITTGVLVVYQAADWELVLTLLPYTMAFSATLAAGVLWGLRKRPPTDPGVAGQRTQAVAAIAMNAVSFALLLVRLHGIVDGLIGLFVEVAFLALVYWLYTRVLVPEPSGD
jgi:hypothetical protein